MHIMFLLKLFSVEFVGSCIELSNTVDVVSNW